MLKYFKKIKKIIEYIPILWEDEDWDISYLLTLISYKVNRMAKCVRGNNYIIDEEIEFQERFAKKLELTINKYLNSEKYFPMQHYADKYNATTDFKETGESHKKYGKLYKMIHIFCDTRQEIPEGHEFYNYMEKYIRRINKYETAAWNRIWSMLEKDGYKLGD